MLNTCAIRQTVPRRVAFAAALLIAGAFAVNAAHAGGGHRHHHRHIHFGFGIGVPIASGLYWRFGAPPVVHYPYYVYPAPRVAVVPAAPVTYIQQSVAPAPAAAAQPVWYWCASANAYHPYVSECPGGWQQVTPQAPPR
ncbi:MAG: hypothetical protein O2975_02320 [Proteobacteria bacterium]|nr:hypothetical protein [Pseudomonadota bacterium]